MATQQSSANAEKIANYSQVISTGVTNLLNELCHANGAASFDPGAIGAQLQTLITLVQGMDTRIAALEQGLQKPDSGKVPKLMEIQPALMVQIPAWKFMPELTAECVLRPASPFYE